MYVSTRDNRACQPWNAANHKMILLILSHRPLMMNHWWCTRDGNSEQEKLNKLVSACEWYNQRLLKGLASTFKTGREEWPFMGLIVGASPLLVVYLPCLTRLLQDTCSIGCNSIRYDLKRECSFTNLVTQMTTVTTPTEWVPNIPVIISGKIHLIGQMKLWHHK